VSRNNRDGDLDPILVASDDGMILADGDRECVRCEYCGERFDPDETATTTIPSTQLYRCPACGRWTEVEND
jgi:DNA-directed RNA polymerase subunit RPC12/RpoP